MTCWNRAAPTEPGWYWAVYGDKGSTPGVIYIDFDPYGDHALIVFQGEDEARYPQRTKLANYAWWSDRLEVPAWPFQEIV